jgi:hypothetical protein
VGVEYRHEARLVDQDLRPSAATLARLVDRMRAERWLPRGDDEASRHLRGVEITVDAMCWPRRRLPTKRQAAGWSWSAVPRRSSRSRAGAASSVR